MVSDLPDYLKKPTYSTRQQQQSTEMEQQLADLAEAMAAIQEQTASIQQAVVASSTLFAEIKPAVLELVAWRPAMEKSVEELQTELGGLPRARS